MRRIGVLQGLSESDPEWSRRFGAFKQRLQELGWTDGRNVAFEFRFAGGKPERLPALAAELVHSAVDVIVTNAAQPIEAARKATSTIPIVMASVGDALGAGYVASLARPGGNVTGLTLVATDQSAKRLQLVKEIVPNLVRVGSAVERQRLRPSPAAAGNGAGNAGARDCVAVISHPNRR
jgi:putative ABC transport system substrate-binding protein